MFCTSCGASLREDMKFCVMCGNVIKTQKEASLDEQAFTPPEFTPPEFPPPEFAVPEFVPTEYIQTQYPTQQPAYAPVEYPQTEYVPIYETQPQQIPYNPGRKKQKSKIWIPITVTAAIIAIAFGALWYFTDILPWSYNGNNNNNQAASSRRDRDTDRNDEYDESRGTRNSGSDLDGESRREEEEARGGSSTISPSEQEPDTAAVNPTSDANISVSEPPQITPILPVPDPGTLSPESPPIVITTAPTEPEIITPEEPPPPPPPEPSTMNLSNHTLPPNQRVGAIFGVRGIIKSNYLIYEVTVAVVNDRGVPETAMTVFPYDYEYDIRNVDFDILFDILTVGTKAYIVEATDELGTQTLLHHQFQVNR